jgi:hypothetical protein
MRTVRFAAALAAALGIPAAAGAQDTPRAGLVIAYPAAVGILWHASDTIAIRPEFNLAGTSQYDVDPTVLDGFVGMERGIRPERAVLPAHRRQPAHLHRAALRVDAFVELRE